MCPLPAGGEGHAQLEAQQQRLESMLVRPAVAVQLLQTVAGLSTSGHAGKGVNGAMGGNTPAGGMLDGPLGGLLGPGATPMALTPLQQQGIQGMQWMQGMQGVQGMQGMQGPRFSMPAEHGFGGLGTAWLQQGQGLASLAQWANSNGQGPAYNGM